MSETKEVAGLVERAFDAFLSVYPIPYEEGKDPRDGIRAVIAVASAANAREIERLQSDLTRYIDIATKEATKAEGLRAERDRLKQAVDHQAKALAQSFGAEKLGWVEKWKARAEIAEATVSTLTRQLEEARGAIETSMTAIDDWLNVYASDFCDAARVAERNGELGTIAYIANVQEKNRAAIRSLKQGERE